MLGLTWIATLRGDFELARKHGKWAYDEAIKSGDRAIQAQATMRMADFDSLLSDTLDRLSEEEVHILRAQTTSKTLKEIGTEDFTLRPV